MSQTAVNQHPGFLGRVKAYHGLNKTILAQGAIESRGQNTVSQHLIFWAHQGLFWS